jgi:3',5'-cyclic AMP phosphodiesterase CpdA
VRVLHISDLHLSVELSAVSWKQWLSKRLFGASSYLLKRRWQFAQSRFKVAALAAFVQEHSVDLVLCTGDSTVLGSDYELHSARQILDPLTTAPQGFITVPGNHDVYAPDASGFFEYVFNDFMETDMPEYRIQGPWPLVRFVGSDVAVVAVTSAHPTALGCSHGLVPGMQLMALERILAEPEVRKRFVFVMTHHAPRRADGTPDRSNHGLSNADRFLSVCANISRGAVLHGHIHHCYSVRAPGIRPVLFGAGSATQRGREGFWLFDVGRDLVATRGRWNGQGYVLDPPEALPRD